jgi:hypothetical protein
MIRADRTKYLRIALLVVGIVAHAGTPSAQEAVKHLNPVVEKLAAGKPFIGFQTGDLSLQNAPLSPAPKSTMCIWRWSTDRWILQGSTSSQSA